MDEPADPLGDLPTDMGRTLRPVGPGARDDPQDEDGAEPEPDGVDAEWEGHADREQERPDRRHGELVQEKDRTVLTSIGHAEIVSLDEARDQGAARGVGKGFRRAQHEQGGENEGDVHEAGHDHGREDDEDDRAEHIDPGDDPAAIVTVGHYPREQSEHEMRQVLAQERERDEKRIARLRRDEQRSGGDRDAIADVGGDRGGEQPTEAASQPSRDDQFDDSRHGAGHRADDISRPVRRSVHLSRERRSWQSAR